MATTDIFRPTILASALLAAGLALPILGLAATITVTGDVDGTLGALAGNSTCDLREAIQAANNDAAVGQCPAGSGADTIAFNIPGAGLHVISIETALGGALPAIATNVTIDGYTQPGSSVNTLADGTNAVPRVALISVGGGVSSGLNFASGAAGAVRGLVIGGFAFTGVSTSLASNIGIHGNFIGTDGLGNAFANGRGVWLELGDNLAIGSADIADRNLISGNVNNEVVVYWNSTNVQISNNLIGTTDNGKLPLVSANSIAIDVLGGNLPTSAVSITGNIVGAAFDGVLVHGNVNQMVIARNSFGVGVGGSDITAGGRYGIWIFDDPVNGAPSDVLVGGVDASEDNVIANWDTGILVTRFSGANPSVKILANSIYNNNNQGIDLADTQNNIGIGVDVNDAGDIDNGPNGFQNYPVASTATTDGVNTSVNFTLTTAPNTPARIDFYANPACHASGNGEGRTWLGTMNATANAGGVVTTTAAALAAAPVGQFVTMTATDTSLGNTSEFSACLAIAAAGAETPPIMGDVPNQTGSVGTAFSLDLNPFASPTDGDAVTLVLAGALPSGLTFDPNTGVVSGTPTTTGSWNVTVSAFDNDGFSNTDAVQITINAAAQTPPIMGDVPNQTGSVGTLFSLALVAYITPTDSDAILSYAATGALPPGLAFNSVAGTFFGTPTTAGTWNVTVTATDNDGASNTDAVQFTIAAAQPSADVAPVPTLSGWAMALLAGLVALFGSFAKADFFATRRR